MKKVHQMEMVGDTPEDGVGDDEVGVLRRSSSLTYREEEGAEVGTMEVIEDLTDDDRRKENGGGEDGKG